MKSGRVTKDWLQFLRQWKKDNPPNHEGYYVCALCGKWVHHTEVTLDHIKNRSTHPHLRLDPDNVQPAHYICNTKKKMQNA